MTGFKSKREAALQLALEALEVGFMGPNIVKYNQAITAIKEALAQEQEPVAWQWLGSAHFRKKIPKNSDTSDWSPLYRTPQRTWVGLTIEEIAACCMESTTTQLSFYNAIEAKLKEKNT